MIKIATMCSGIGSPEQAIKELNIPHEITFAIEIDKYARQTYLANFSPKIMLEDMTKTDFSNPDLYTDIVLAGIPCQSFSLAGKQPVSDSQKYKQFGNTITVNVIKAILNNLLLI